MYQEFIDPKMFILQIIADMPDAHVCAAPTCWTLMRRSLYAKFIRLSKA